MFELFGGREDLQVLESVAGFADERALELAQEFLGGLGAVLVQRIGPAPGHPGQEIRIILGRGAGQGVFHPGRRLGVADVPDTLQRQRNDRRGPGRDLPGRDGGPELPVHGGQRFARESLPRQQAAREAEPAAGLGGTDPQPGPQELRRVPVPVVHGSSGRSRSRAGRGGRASTAAGAAAPGVWSGPAVPSPASSRQPVVHEVPAFVTAAAACFRVRSTAPAATTCRYSMDRESSSTVPAKSDAFRKSHKAASAAAVNPTSRSMARAASAPSTPATPESPAGAMPRPESSTAMKSLTASMKPNLLRGCDSNACGHLCASDRAPLEPGPPC